MIRPDRIDVYIDGKHVGTLAETKYRAAFQYSDEWLEEGFSISPFSLPLEKRLFIPAYEPFEGLFGVFADTLPDGWGRLIVDRYIKRSFKLNAQEINGYNRLTLVSNSGMGAMEYRPSVDFSDERYQGELDEIANECKKLLEEKEVADLDRLFLLGGSSGGARPKVHAIIDGEEWIIKFPSSHDDREIGEQEYIYSVCARECGLEMSQTRLFDSQKCQGYFGTKRFDRDSNGRRIHMISASGLLETSHRYPNLDYNQLMKLTQIITRDIQEVKKLFDLMCFNVYAHNRDDHSKNFSFLYLIDDNRWVLSPPYDLTYSSSLGGEHATTIDGEGRNPVLENILQVAKRAGLDAKYAKARANEIKEITNSMLRKYLVDER